MFESSCRAMRILAALCLLCAVPACDKDRESGSSEPYAAPPSAYATPAQTVSARAPIYSSAPAVLMPQPATAAALAGAPNSVSPVMPEIRVAVHKDAFSVRVSAPACGARIVLNGLPWKQLPPNAMVTVTQAGASLLLEGQPLNAPLVRFESFSPDAFMKLNDKDISACVVLSRPAARNGILALAQLNVEEYLAGVLAGEVPYERWHPEALKAQAVVSRTYALHEIRAHAGEAYDVDNTVMSQVFKGGCRNIPALSQAINATHGQALTSNGVVFPAFFHSTCGGHTEAAAGIFPEHALVRPLCGVNCPYCTQSPGYRWSAKFSKQALGLKMRTLIPNVGQIESLSFSDAKGLPLGAPGASGGAAADFRRVQTVLVKHTNGTSSLQGNAFRLAVGPRELKSLLWGQIADRGDALEISGAGFGHGVGLCQYGSQGMAQAGESYTRILGFYFPGAALTRLF